MYRHKSRDLWNAKIFLSSALIRFGFYNAASTYDESRKF